MSNHGITADNLVATLPEALRADQSIVALATAAASVLASRVDEINRVLIYPAIDTLPEDLLDLLAMDFAVDWWDGDWPVERKRQSLKDSWRIHRILGTPEAVALAAQAAFGAGEVQEWFEYGGTPNHFRVVGLGPEMALTGYAAFLRLLGIVKRESSVLDAVVMESRHGEELHAGCGLAMRCRRTIDCEALPGEVTYLVDELGNILADENNARYIDTEED